MADGPAPEVMVASPAFAPQVAKILAPLGYLTMDQVVRRPPGGQADDQDVPWPSAPGSAPAWSSPWPRSSGFVAFLWPFVVAPGKFGDATMAPLMFGALLVLVLAVIVAEIADGGIDAKAIAMLGVLAAIGAALRPLGAGTAGIETVFFTIVIAGRVFGSGFGFTLGCTTLFASALITGGVGPWMPYQMFGCAWVGLFAGLLPPATGRREVLMLAAYGALLELPVRLPAQSLLLALLPRPLTAASPTCRARHWPSTSTAT